MTELIDEGRGYLTDNCGKEICIDSIVDPSLRLMKLNCLGL